jgi:hypothetical protein
VAFVGVRARAAVDRTEQAAQFFGRFALQGLGERHEVRREAAVLEVVGELAEIQERERVDADLAREDELEARQPDAIDGQQ